VPTTPTRRRVVLITGGSSGLSQAAADAFVSAGWTTTATARVPVSVKRLASDRVHDALVRSQIR
jgi:NAD(P)-dependent dehydrogenase (short-subunit alcohol dehydrogenase family)